MSASRPYQPRMWLKAKNLIGNEPIVPFLILLLGCKDALLLVPISNVVGSVIGSQQYNIGYGGIIGYPVQRGVRDWSRSLWELDHLKPPLWFTLDYLCDAIYVIDTIVHAHEDRLACRRILRYFAHAQTRKNQITLVDAGLIYLLHRKCIICGREQLKTVPLDDRDPERLET
ncbi:Cyclic nucleotide-gated cation channel subunit A [Eumeta japonica]|uniref:Cyclic nucleotide-gated cation channel subunit A n=1 Tax=Eumeta variegata TaxID=151549 RepID=A0A4C2ACZ1_EUMVA|nr:Cyclic nucleotide-gated cation channel subunit A [Eumeta japonica]